jgi:hypothetical protein
MMTRFHDELNRHHSGLEIIDLTADVVKALSKGNSSATKTPRHKDYEIY